MAAAAEVAARSGAAQGVLRRDDEAARRRGGGAGARAGEVAGRRYRRGAGEVGGRRARGGGAHGAEVQLALLHPLSYSSSDGNESFARVSVVILYFFSSISRRVTSNKLVNSMRDCICFAEIMCQETLSPSLLDVWSFFFFYRLFCVASSVQPLVVGLLPTCTIANYGVFVQQKQR